MIYQLAKTSPSITGQVKMNFVLKGNEVVDLQYVPISNHIKFNYNNPQDVLNYSHGENIAKLYKKISGVFYSPIHKPSIDEHSLHRYNTIKDDTHEETYEMGMKRLEYKRYNKQFEFFTPIWCDTKQELQNIEFELCFKNPKSSRLLYSKMIEFRQDIKNYLDNCWVNKEDEDQDLVYIDFRKNLSYVKGINAENGLVQVCDTSSILNTLLERERPVLEVDNLITNQFRQNKLVATQIFNFSFAFSISDVLPLQMLDDFNCERVNVYINVYKKHKEKYTAKEDKDGVEIEVEKEIYKYDKVEVKDLYSNYDYIPRYNISSGKYDSDYNVLDYMEDYKCVDLIDKNKLVQSTFHWTLRDNPESIFNLYNGFAPVYKQGEKVYQSSRISCNEPDLYTDVFDPLKNPYGIFKYIDLSNYGPDMTIYDLMLVNKQNFYHLKIDANSKEFVTFGNLFVDTKKVDESLKYIDFYFNIIRVSNLVSMSNIKNSLSVGEGEFKFFVNIDSKNSKNICFNDKESECLCKITDKDNKEFYLTFFVRDFVSSEYNKILFANGLLNFEKYITTSTANSDIDIVNCLKKVSKLLNALDKQQVLTFEGSVSKNLAKSPSNQTNELIYNKSEQNVLLYRYSSNLLPMFINTNIDHEANDENWKNRVYFTKQYDKDIVDYITDPKKDENITEFVKYQQSKFIPVFPSINYFSIDNPKDPKGKPEEIDYTKHFLYEDLYKEITWYKNNSLFNLPELFYYEDEKDTGYEFQRSELVDIVKKKLIVLGNDIFYPETDENNIMKNNAIAEYILNLYSYAYKTEYKSINEIDKQKIEIKFTLK